MTSGLYQASISFDKSEGQILKYLGHILIF
jgi:hypothetical protein